LFQRERSALEPLKPVDSSGSGSSRYPSPLDLAIPPLYSVTSVTTVRALLFLDQLDIARVRPHKRRRWRILARDPVLFARLKAFFGDDFSDKILASWDSLNSEVPSSGEVLGISIPGSRPMTRKGECSREGHGAMVHPGPESYYGNYRMPLT
jgi:hypothetical protein